jgi:hypothetical protein
MYARQVCVFCCYDWLMVDDRALRFRQEYRAPVSRPLAPTRKPATNIFGQPVDYDRNANVGKAIAGTALGALDVPVQAIGGMVRDVVSGRQAGGQSAGSRAVGDYGNLVRNLWSDVGGRGAGQTEPFLPREFEGAGEAAVNRFNLEGGAASAARGGATALDLLTGLGAGTVGGVVRGAAANAPLTASRLRATVTEPDAYAASLWRRIIDDPETEFNTVRSTASAPDIIGGSGVFRSSRDTGTSGAHSGAGFDPLYNRLRDTFEDTVSPGSRTAYGYLTNPVLRTTPEPFPIGNRGRENYLYRRNVARTTDPMQPGALSYGAGGETRNPVRYRISPEAMERASVSWGDSLRGAPTFNSVDDLRATLGQGLDAVRGTQGKADWGWMGQTPRVPAYLEAQIPNLTIDDISGIVATGDELKDAASMGMSLADLVEQSGRNIPVTASTQSLNYPRVSSSLRQQLESSPAYQGIIDSLRSQRADVLPANLQGRSYANPSFPQIDRRGSDSGGLYESPRWSTAQITGQNPSAVLDYLQNAMKTQIAPQLRALQNRLVPPVEVPRRFRSLDDLESEYMTRPAFQ